MQLHASCAARDGAGVLLTGPAGSGKSDLLLRLLDHGFQLVADDRVDLTDQVASAPDRLAGLLEVRGLGIVRLPFVPTVRLVVAIALEQGERLPMPETRLGLPLVRIDPTSPSAPARVVMAWKCATGRIPTLVGALP